MEAPAASAPVSLPLASPSRWRRAEARLRAYLPEGRGLPAEEWRIRHRGVLAFVFAHAIGLAIFGLVRDWPPAYALGEGALIAALGAVAALPMLSRSMRGAVAAVACVTSSAVLVQFWGGVIEGHFHFFVVVALISLYQDWAPFLVCVGFVAIDHGLIGTLAPTWVYNHPSALAHPWRWAVIHAVLVLAECAALIAVWRANEQARAQTDRVLRSAGEGILGVDQDCRIVFANPAAVKMLGGTEADVLGRPLDRCILGGDGRPLFNGPQILRQIRGAFSVEAVLSRDGEALPVEILCTPYEGQAHEAGAVVALRDISERRRADEERAQGILQQQELDRLREVNQFKTRFMNMAAHELNTPLTPIQIQLALLKRNAAASADVPRSQSIQMLDRNFQRLSQLVQELLDSTRLQGNHLKVEPRPADLAPLLTEVVESFQPAADDAGIELRLEANGPLPCRVDSLRFSQALFNLLSNALKFTPRGGTARVVAAAANGDIRVAVADTGIGLSPEQAAKLFQPFSQVHESQVADHRGSGLGLYISRGILELHGGRLDVESDGPGRGSTFTMTFPAQGPPAAAPAQAIRAPAAA